MISRCRRAPAAVAKCKGTVMNLGEKRKYGAIYADLRW